MFCNSLAVCHAVSGSFVEPPRENGKNRSGKRRRRMVSSTVRIHNFFADFKGKFFAITSIYEYLQHITKNYFQDFLTRPPVFPLPPTWRRWRGRGERRVGRLRGRGDTAIHPSFHRPPLFPPPPGGIVTWSLVEIREATPPRPRPGSFIAFRPGGRNCPINDTESPQPIGIAGFVVNMQLNFPFLRRRRPLVGLQ